MVSMIPILFLIFSIQCQSADRGCENNIESVISLSVNFTADTVYQGEELSLTVVFENVTDSSLSFYPKAILSIIRPTAGFEYESYLLNKSLDFRYVSEIIPKGIYEETYIVKANEQVFKTGKNHLKLYYYCKRQKGKYKKYNKLYGSLESREFVIFVK